MSSDVLTVRLHLRRLRMLEVEVDEPDRLVVVEDTRSVVRCAHCGLRTNFGHRALLLTPAVAS